MELWKYSADVSENDVKMVENCIAVLNGQPKVHHPRVCVPCNGAGWLRPATWLVGGEACWNCNGKGHRA